MGRWPRLLALGCVWTGGMKPRPTAIGLEQCANYLGTLLPSFDRMPLDEQERSRTALRLIAGVTQLLRSELGDACPACGAVVAEGVAH